MPAFHEVLMPVRISYGASFGPEFFTKIGRTDGGFEQRIPVWANARMKGDVAKNIHTSAEYLTVLHFFSNRLGRAYGFRVMNPLHFRVADQNLGTGDGVEVDFQLRLEYTDPLFTGFRDIKKIADTSFNTATVLELFSSGFVAPVVKEDGTPNGAVTVDINTGVATFPVAPAGAVVIEADFDFHEAMRFDIDYLPASLDEFESLNLQSIPLTGLLIA